MVFAAGPGSAGAACQARAGRLSALAKQKRISRQKENRGKVNGFAPESHRFWEGWRGEFQMLARQSSPPGSGEQQWSAPAKQASLPEFGAGRLHGPPQWRGLV